MSVRQTTLIGTLSPRPLVSIIVPSYNQGAYIRATLDSIMEQTYRPIEIIVVDGASTDQTLEVLHSYNGIRELSWISEPDGGVADAVNKGFRRAQGEVVAIQSSDDAYFPDAVALAVKALQEDSDAALVYGDVMRIDASGQELSRTFLAPFSLEGFLSVETFVPQPSAFFRMDVARSLGGWREEFQYTPDTDLWMRIAFRWKVKKLDVVMAKQRRHDAQRDRQGKRIIRDYGRMIDTSSDLRQASPRLRRAARAGKLLQRNRYGYQDPPWIKFWRLWTAALIFPPILQHVSVGGMIPGYFMFRRFASRVKKVLTHVGSR